MLTKTANGRLYELECLRGFAAVYVLAFHALKQPLTSIHPKLGLLVAFSQEAVMLFFLLSGFVVRYSVLKTRNFTWKNYLISRFTRVYPIFLLALLLPFVIEMVRTGFHGDPRWRELFGNLLMLQDTTERVGGWFAPYMGNSPLWSLSYEMFFYLAYAAIASTLPRDRQTMAALFVSLAGVLFVVAFPSHGTRLFAYLLIWWMGVVLCDVYEGIAKPSEIALVIVGLLAGAAIWIAWLTIAGVKASSPEARELASPLFELRHWVGAILITLILIGWASLKWRGFRLVFGVFFPVAPISYGLYALHYPITVRAAALFPNTPHWLFLSISIAVAFLVAYLAEIPFQRAVNHFTRSWKGSARPQVKPTSMAHATVYEGQTEADLGIAPAAVSKINEN
jgi:peptidoglycan/LPS O-acetylase OafA/YrhL